MDEFVSEFDSRARFVGRESWQAAIPQQVTCDSEDCREFSAFCTRDSSRKNALPEDYSVISFLSNLNCACEAFSALTNQVGRELHFNFADYRFAFLSNLM
jgi:hypothetical protein